MPSVFFISPFQPPIWEGDSDLILEVNEYTKLLLQDWPGAEITINLDSQTYIASWQLPAKDGAYISGGLQNGQQVVSCQGTAKGVADFVLWHRKIIDNKHQLFLFDDGLHINMEITKQTKQEEIVEKILSP